MKYQETSQKSFDLTPLAEQTILVAGATGAIGRAVCALLLSHGARVIAEGRDQNKLSQLKKDHADVTKRFHAVLTSDESWNEDGSLTIPEGLFPFYIDSYIHSVGLLVPGALAEIDHETAGAVIDSNLMTVIRAAQNVLPGMMKRGNGSFIVIGSLGGIVPMPYQAVYCASKFGLRGLCLSLREEVRHHGITVSLVAPGPVRSPMLDREAADPRAVMCFVPSVLRPIDIAQKVLQVMRARTAEVTIPSVHRYLASAANAFPGLFRLLYPLLSVIGRRRRSWFLTKHSPHKEHGYESCQHIQTAQH